MPAVEPGATVLVTGASGGVGSYIVKGLSEAGFQVRAAVRSIEKGEYVKTLGPEIDYIIVEEMTAPDAYDVAVIGVDAIVHASSKPDVTNTGDPARVIKPAVEGVQNLLASVEKAGSTVQRVVLISSAAAVTLSMKGIHDEKEWNDEVVDTCTKQGAAAPMPYKYHASKVVSERAFWTFFQSPHKAKCDGVALLPAYVFGPPLEFSTTKGAITSSNAVLVPWVTGDVGDVNIEEPFYAQVAATDVAMACEKALTIEQAGGERFILEAGPTFLNDFALAAEAAKVGVGIPKGNHDKGFRAELAKNASKCDSSKAKRVLGIRWRDTDKVLAETMAGVAKVLHVK